MNNGAGHPGSGGGGGNPGGGGGRRRRGRRGKRGAAPQGKGSQQPGNNQSQPAHHGHGQGQRPGGGGGGFRRRRTGGGGGGGKNAQPGIYTAPMDHSYRAVLNGNGNVADPPRRGPRPGFSGTQYVQPDPEPIATRDGEPPPNRIFAFIDDLFFLAKIREVSKKLNLTVEFVRSDKEMWEKIESGPANEDGTPILPALVIIDLNNAAIKPITLIKNLKKKLKKGTSIVGFLSHVQGELKLEAQEAGCDMVVPRSAFSANLPNLLRRHAAEDEEEI